MNYDNQEIKKLIKDFYEVTGQRIALFDRNFNIITKYPEKRCDFCEHIRSTEKGHIACTCSDNDMLKKASLGKTVRLKCHAGLLEICAPIIDDMGISGYLMFGQILYDTEVQEQLNKIKKLTKDYFTKKDFDEKISSIRSLSPEYLDSVENIMTACISYIHLNKMLNAAKTGLWAQIDYYIERNFTSQFSLEDMSNDLGFCISTICKTVKAHSGKTIHQLLTIKRIAKAKNLLKTTNLNVNEVSDSVGIHDYNYFTKIFKKNVGLTPTQFRKR